MHNPLDTLDDRPDAAFEASWRQLIKRRVLVVLAVLGVWVAGIQARLIDLQVIQHDALATRAEDQQHQSLTLSAKRGDLLDRRGRTLAVSVDADSVSANPEAITDVAGTARALCNVLSACDAAKREQIARKLDSGSYRKKTYFAYIERLVSPSVAARVAALELDGISLTKETRRYYPNKDLAAHVLGFVNVDSKGMGGIEATYDSVIRGHDGHALAQVDARQNRLQMRVDREPTAGATVELTIDVQLQYILERELRAGVEENRALGGTAIVLNPGTGEILAQASYPTFNPNAPRDAPADARRNRAVQDVYEPGSTFKIVTASAALEGGIVKPDDLIDTNPGFIKIGSRKPILDTHPHGVISFEDVIVLSSNVGAIKVGLRTGADALSRYVYRFGFGQLNAPDYSGVSRGVVFSPASMDDSALASMSMGYQISVTPLQMAMAASAVANGGLLMEPHLVRAIERNGVRQVVEPKVIRRVIEPSTAATLTTIMEDVPVRGTAKAAAIDRYRVAGKTGTAAKVVDGRYSDTDFNASFVGFVPSRNPAYVILVVIDSPHAGHHYGGDVAAPVFKRVAEAVLGQMGVPPSINPVPPIVVTADAADVVPAQPARATVIPVATTTGGQTLMPDLRGLSGREAVRVLGTLGLRHEVSGSGFVETQNPAAGEPVERGDVGILYLTRWRASGPSGGRR
jgi:cell division protein FtsI/penicillin-binding protein 2